MLPSPTSSLSSFRDYYHHTSDYSQQALTSEQFINQGITNFKISKVFTKFNWKVNQQSYWALFYAFKKLQRNAKKSQLRRRAGLMLMHILKKQTHKEGRIIVQSNYLQQIWVNMKEEREKQVSRMISFGLKFIKRNYINAALSYHQVIKKLTRSRGVKQEVSVQKKKYILKLSKAVLSILLRNVIQKKIFNYFKQIKFTPNNHQQAIAFFKPKKEKVYHQRRQNSKTLKVAKSLPLLQILQRKIITSFKIFFIKAQRKRKNQGDQSDNTGKNSIFTHVVRHMIYVTGGGVRQREKERKNQEQEIKIFKLSQILKRNRTSKSFLLRQFVLRWRSVVNEQNLLLSRQIAKLQSIKKYYMDQS